MKPKITFVSDAHDVRLDKEAYVLNRMGYDIIHITQNIRKIDSFHINLYYETPIQLKKAVLLASKETDIFHVHNEPSWMAVAIREVLPKAKIIMDYHDSNYWRMDLKKNDELGFNSVFSPDEDIAVPCVDGFVVPSRECANELKTRTKKPIVVLPPACSEHQFRYGPWGSIPSIPGLCIQGGMAISKPGDIYGWRDYTELCKQLKDKIKIYMYSSYFRIREYQDHYAPLAHILTEETFANLLDVMGKHTWGVVGNITDCPALKYFMPNKAFDYIAAGVPIVNFGGTAIS
ncbi:unnamed protein product, partial [marine sediment metagenome]